MQYIKKFLAWVLVSSENPQQVSLTLKGALMLAIPTIMWAAGLGHFNAVTSDTLTLVINQLSLVVASILGTIGTVITAWGAIRKVVNTWFIPTPPPAPAAPVTPATPVVPAPSA